MDNFLTLLAIGALYMPGLLALSAGNQIALYRSLQISFSRLSSGARMSDSVTLPLTRGDLWRSLCSKACSQFDWCNLWCPDSSPSNTATTTTTCLLFQMYVVHGYQETNTADAIECYKPNVKDYAVGASIEASRVNSFLKIRAKDNLVDGIFDFFDPDQCFYSAFYFNPYFKLSFGSVKPIRRVMFLLQRNSFVKYFYDFKVLVGTEDYPEAEFSKYQLFGYFPGPSSPSQEVSFSYTEPVLAKYVVVQRMSDTACNPDGSSSAYVCHLQICHVEIN